MNITIQPINLILTVIGGILIFKGFNISNLPMVIIGYIITNIRYNV